MLSLFKRKSSPDEKQSVFQRLKQGLSKTRAHLSTGLSTLILGKKVIGADLLAEIETQLLTADVGVDATDTVIAALTDQLSRHQLNDPSCVIDTLKKSLCAILKPRDIALDIPEMSTPFVILMVGVNGAGKTTTIGKLACYFKQAGKSVMLAAGDTFRAAAIEQLQAWGERNNIPVITQQPGADSAAVIYDAFSAAKARKIDILIADTAGRLHTQKNLMEELKKVKRVLNKIDPSAPHETMLILDAGIGQNALTQTKQFHEAIGITGISLTKLDGTAKGGILFAIADQVNVPFRFIGVGEKIEDLQDFSAELFVEALFD